MKKQIFQAESERVGVLGQSPTVSIDAERITFQDIRDHLTGPVLSVAFHIILFSILATFFISNEKETEDMVEIEAVVIVLPLESKVDKVEIPNPPDIPDNKTTDRDNYQDKDYSSPQPDIKFVPNDQPPGQEGDKMDDNFNFKQIDIADIGKFLPKNKVSSIPKPGPYIGRLPGRIKDILITQDAMGTDDNLIIALKWLKEHQNADGSWGDENSRKPALTGLATLAFLGRGIEIGDSNFGGTLIKALKKLIEFGNNTAANGVINGDGNGYCHPIVAYALSEAFSLTKISHLEEVMNRMTTVMVQGQNKYGSYNYRYRNIPEEKTGEPRCDLSYAGWNFQALKAAFTAGSNAPGIENALERSINAIQKIHSGADGSFTYGAAKGGTGSISMTSVGTLCLQLLNAGRSPEAVKGLKWIENSNGGKFMNCGWKDNSGSPWALYTWYYQTQAIFQGGGGKGDPWNKWNDKFLKGALVKEQERDGHWSSPYEKYGSRNGQGHGEGTGSVFKDSSLDLNIYSTSMCCLMLEVYYRYLATYKVASIEEKKRTNPMGEEIMMIE
ncbi:MAG TPA: hypothetical protein DCZ94_19220 [Lentisphaeria bacterium]|nr:MAG: hypothetical protein A2X48_01465 [Lentisphaerae bacterium GWF2_49_21]HBC89075.1 hypothetical protein [Lentisphaeria bacterium]